MIGRDDQVSFKRECGVGVGDLSGGVVWKRAGWRPVAELMVSAPVKTNTGHSKGGDNLHESSSHADMDREREARAAEKTSSAT